MPHMNSGVLDWHILADQGHWDACCVQIIQQEAERTPVPCCWSGNTGPGLSS